MTQKMKEPSLLLSIRLISVVLLQLVIPTVVCQQTLLPDPCSSAANYDGTDIGRPYLVDNSTGTPVYTYLDDEDYHPPSNRSKRAATAKKNYLWPHGIVPCNLYSDLTASEKEKILSAMRHWEEKTCIRFQLVPYASLQSGVVFYSGTKGCCSYIGRIEGYIQPVSIAPWCSYSTTVHEIGHVLGFWHEQSRPDRDQYVTIHTKSIVPGQEYNFVKKNSSDINSLGTPYDFSSIMHYSSGAFAKNNSITISSKIAKMPFGRAPELSPLDIKQTNLLYKDQCALRSWTVSRLPSPNPSVSPVVIPSGVCYHHLIGRAGSFSVPSFYCVEYVWIIEVPEGYTVNITFYNVEIASPCAYFSDSYIIVYPWYTEEGNYIHFCGDYVYNQLTTTTRFAYVKYRAASVVNRILYDGFSSAVYTSDDVDECSLDICDHYCINLIGSYKCSCRPGYYLAGTYRCFDVNECLNNNGGCSHKCVNMAGTYHCECPVGHTLHSNGQDCDLISLTCDFSNGGCEHVCTNTQSGVTCLCSDGYQLTGNYRNCTDIDECATAVHNCTQNQQCVNRLGSFMCECIRGYRLLNGVCKDIDECLNNNGSCSHDCVNTAGSYYCQCPTGYVLLPNNHDCEDINECLSNNGGCSHNCTNTVGSYYCECATGYLLQSNKHNCREKLTCQWRNGGCDHACIDTETGVNCSCYDGYQLIDNQTCSDIDECAAGIHNCSQNQECINDPGGYHCLCITGYELLNGTCEGVTCQRSNGKCDQVCSDTVIGVNCSCYNGYQLIDNHNCSDIDECATGVHNCTQNEQCVNTPGDYDCECFDGYEIVNGTCEDIDECLNNNSTCSHICVNTKGSYHCECPTGYALHHKNHYCEDINECLDGICSHQCINSVGSYHCECPTGYVLHPNKHDCKDIDECLNNSLCSDRCLNTEGSYQCECFAGYTLQFNQHDCEDINECLSNNGGCNHICVNTEGSFECLCNTSYILSADNKTCTPNVSKCDYVLEEPSGHINTSGFPNSPYPPNSNCTWIIDLPTYKSIELKFIEMDIEQSTNCVKDQVTTLNGKDEDALSLGSYCGNKLPATIYSSTETVVIKFMSDSSINKKGFNLQYRGLKGRSKDTTYGCNLIPSTNIRFALATFPSKYNRRTDCAYYFLFKVKLTFLYLDMVDADCSTDRIEIYDGFAASVPSVKICNGNKVVEFISSGSNLRMKYIGNSIGKYRGFHALVTFL